MTPAEWHEHAARCREVARTMEDATARRVLLEAAEDYGTRPAETVSFDG